MWVRWEAIVGSGDGAPGVDIEQFYVASSVMGDWAPQAMSKVGPTRYMLLRLVPSTSLPAQYKYLAKVRRSYMMKVD